jgi:hypothetical protein
MKKLLTIGLAISVLVACSKGSFKRPSSKGKTGTEQATGNGEGVNGGDGSENSGENSPAGLNLVWKRYRALEDGLMKGLGLPKNQVCTELGVHSCIDTIHLTVLGGNEPYVSGQYERVHSPTVLTAVAVDRVVLSACGRRLEMDRTAGTSAVIFKHFPLSGGAPNADQVKAQATELYRRLLARDPEANELQMITSFAGSAGSPDKLALSLCFAIGSNAENIFL